MRHAPSSPMIRRLRRQAWRIASNALILLSAMHPLASGTASAAPSKPAQPAQPALTKVYRCQQPDGRVLYAQQACEASGGGGSRLMQIADTRTAEQARQGETIHKRDAKLIKRMQRERQQAERQGGLRKALALTVPRDTAGKKPAARDKSKKTDPRAPKPLTPAGFTARVPGTTAKRQGPRASGKSQPGAASAL